MQLPRYCAPSFAVLLNPKLLSPWPPRTRTLRCATFAALMHLPCWAC